MNKKLTLRLDDQLISAAKDYAGDAGKTQSQVVAEYFAVTTSLDRASFHMTPAVANLRGILKDGDGASEEDYLAHLKEKHD